ncbi:MAG: PhoH family protein, partial [Moraxellaceae bacterium]|nr:PhoH family protein [Moraxellaceae bacterium]
MNDINRTLDFNELSVTQFKTILGEYNNHLKYIQDRLEVKIHQQQAKLIIAGALADVERAELVLQKLAEESENSDNIS